MISSNFVHSRKFMISLLRDSKFFGNILHSLEFQKIWTHYAKAMAKDNKVNIAVAYHSPMLHPANIKLWYN